MEEQTSRPPQVVNQWRIPEWFSDLSPDALGKLKMFHVELLKFNNTINLISTNTIYRADSLHFADSIIATRLILSKTKKSEFIDLGSGNGFPGLVFGILAPDKHVVLVDSDQRKTEFLKHVISLLGLNNVTTQLKRIEDIPAGSINGALTRGFANIPKTLLMLRKSMAPGGEVYHLKGSEWALEVASIPTQLCSTWNTGHVGDYILPGGDESRIVIFSEHI